MIKILNLTLFSGSKNGGKHIWKIVPRKYMIFKSMLKPETEPEKEPGIKSKSDKKIKVKKIKKNI